MRWRQMVSAVFFFFFLPAAVFPALAEQVEMPPAVQAAVLKLETRFHLKPEAPAIVVDTGTQQLFLIQNSKVLAIYPVSTAKNGVGNQNGSNQTPTGTHRICEKYGKDAPVGTIFRARRNTGKIAKIYTDQTNTPNDYVTTRILRLEGMETGVNRGKGVDSYRRYIYIHGTPEEGLIGTPESHGCIRMKNADVIALFNAVPVGTLVEILPASADSR